MRQPHSFYRFTIMVFLALALQYSSLAQCSPQTGAPPKNSDFNTGKGTTGEKLPPNSKDLKWTIGLDSITAAYNPATIMGNLSPVYYQSQYNDCAWISFSDNGEHVNNRFFFFKTGFNLPCFDLCNKSFNLPNTFCLSMDIYTDNSVYEIYVNGVPQSNVIPGIPVLPDPYNPGAGHTQSDKTSVTLCKDWKAGSNELIIQVASSATVVGMLVQGAVHPVPPVNIDTIPVSICEGTAYHFGDAAIIKPGYYFHAFPRPGQCDSNVAIQLTVNHRPVTTIKQTICEGQSYAGHTTSGTYADTFTTVNGCDSIQMLELIVLEKPKPDMGIKSAICFGDTVILHPGPFATYLWQDGSTADSFVVRQPGIYSVSVSNTCGTALGQLIVKDGVCNMYFPNAFTPDNNRKNDVFKIITDLVLDEYRLEVYNRWGQKIFETTDPLRGWDGTFADKEQPAGAFAWVCWYRRGAARGKMKGTVVLLRERQ